MAKLNLEKIGRKLNEASAKLMEARAEMLKGGASDECLQQACLDIDAAKRAFAPKD